LSKKPLHSDPPLVKPLPVAKGGSVAPAPSRVRYKAPPQPLSPFQRESIDLFVGAFSVLSLPRSLGEIYGLLYSSEEPLAFDDLVTRLDLSKGSVSEGLRLLRSLGAVNLAPVDGSRKDHFTAEISLRRLAGGYLRDRIEPYLSGGESRIEALRRVRDAGAINSSRNDFQERRINQLLSWHRFFGKVLPVFKALAGKI
jgi:DNA-binding transcriptional regulator GbsR (MarR family)